MTVEAKVTRSRGDLYTVRVTGTSSMPEARVAAHDAVAARLGISRWDAKGVQMRQRQQPRGWFHPEWTVTLRARAAGEEQGPMATDELRESEVTLVIRVQHRGSMVPALMLAAMAAQGVANGTGERGRVTARVQSACIVDQRPLTHGEGFGLRTGRDDREVVA